MEKAGDFWSSIVRWEALRIRMRTVHEHDLEATGARHRSLSLPSSRSIVEPRATTMPILLPSERAPAGCAPRDCADATPATATDAIARPPESRPTAIRPI